MRIKKFLDEKLFNEDATTFDKVAFFLWVGGEIVGVSLLITRIMEARRDHRLDRLQTDYDWLEFDNNRLFEAVESMDERVGEQNAEIAELKLQVRELEEGMLHASEMEHTTATQQ